jgi:hypothetical protein
MGRAISVEIYTASHRILGRLAPGSSGLFTFLNIPTTSYIAIEGAHLTRLHQPGRMVARYATLWLVKDEIAVVLLSSRSELGSAGRTRGGYTTTVPHWVQIIMGGYELRGQVESAGKFDFGAYMFEGASHFMPLYHAEVFAVLFPNIQADSPVLLYNRQMVDAMAMLPKEEIPSIESTPS